VTLPPGRPKACHQAIFDGVAHLLQTQLGLSWSPVRRLEAAEGDLDRREPGFGHENFGGAISVDQGALALLASP